MTDAPTAPTPDGVVVEEITAVRSDDLAALQSLIPALSSSAPALTHAALEDIVTSPASVLFVARRNARVVGSLTLVIFSAPTGKRGWIEDVVVATTERGAGIGAALVDAALKRALETGARTVDLTSRPSREAANRLYLRLGFEVRQTNVYRRNLDGID